MRVAVSSLSLPRNPLLRALVVVVGIVLLAGLITMGLLVGAAVVAGAAIAMVVRRLLNGRSRRTVDPTVIEGEFTTAPPRSRPALRSSD